MPTSWINNAINHLQAPGLDGSEVLAASMYHETAKLFGHGARHVTDPGYYAPTYPQDAWPVRELTTVYRVERQRLTKLNLVLARNEYAEGCAYQRWLGTRMVRVSVSAPWPVGSEGWVGR